MPEACDHRLDISDDAGCSYSAWNEVVAEASETDFLRRTIEAIDDLLRDSGGIEHIGATTWSEQNSNADSNGYQGTAEAVSNCRDGKQCEIASRLMQDEIIR